MSDESTKGRPPDPEEEIFEACLARPLEERAGYLNQVCAGDAALRQRVEELLRSHKLTETFLEEPPVSLGAGQAIPLDVPLAEKVGDHIGRYKLLQQIGEGGCGLVYMAEQEEPVKRRVALKVIKLGMDTKNVIARFEAERQALALMDHPNIAKVLDAGATDKGRPYFVMELVRGVKITDYCDQNGLSTRERLLLFVQVCQAIQHAHQKGIIHRDIKPSNILVTLRDGVPVPKVIDFGIAKATTDQRLTDKTLFTAFEQFIGTPTYMSPEQAEMSELGIDTRSDIYSLGVLLYELLTGQTPFDSNRLLQSGLDEIRRIIREQEPVRPSTRLNTMLAGELTTTAQRRQTEPAKLSGLIRGDLDWIVMKALEKNRSRRYETANGFAADIQRHLNNEPVVASPPGNLYRLQKLVRRNKLVFMAAGAVAAALIFALGASIMVAIRIQRENQQIRQAKDDATEKLRASYLAEARARRFGGQAGQRFASLDAVQKAAAIRPDLEARNAAIACLAIADLRVAKQITITGHAHNEHACFDLNLEQYAFGDPNGNITIRAASNNLVLEVLSPSAGYSLESVRAFSPDGKYLSARYSRDGEGESYWVWDLKEQKTVIRAFVQSDNTNAVIGTFANDFSPDSRLFATGRADGAIAIFETGSGHEVYRHPGTRRFRRLQFNHEDALLACFGIEDSRVEIKVVASGRNLPILQCPGGVSAVAWSLDGKRLATACPDFSIQVWDAETGQRQTMFDGDTGYVMSLDFNHAGNLLASAGMDGKIRLWDAETGRQVAVHPGTSWQIQFSPDDRYLMGWQELARFGWLEVVANREYRQLYVPRDVGFISEPVFSPDGRILAAGSQNNIRFWDANSWQRLGSIHQPSNDKFLFNPDGRRVVGVDGINGLRLRDLEQMGGRASSAYRLGKPRFLYGVASIKGASFSSDGRYLAVTEPLKDKACVFDLRNPGAKVVLATHPRVDRVALSPDGRWAATASFYDTQVKVWDARSGDLLRSFSMPDRAYVTFSPDGRWLAASSSQYQLWEVGSWQPKGPPTPGFQGLGANFTAFSPDGMVMARADGQKILLLETLAEKPLATLEPLGSPTLQNFQFSPDGAKLAVVQNDQQVEIWDLRLIRQELAQMHLDWDMPPYPPVTNAPGESPVTLEIEPDPDSPNPALGETNSAAR